MSNLNSQLQKDESSAPEDRLPITAFVVCYNEEEQIADCLRSISFCDEVIVIDSFSKDRTLELVQEFGAKIIQREWPGYRAQKAFGLSVASHEWVLNIDADERVSDELRESILKVLRELKAAQTLDQHKAMEEISGYYVNRVVYYLGRWWRKGGWYPEYRIRFFCKSKTVWGGVDPHEKPIVTGKTAFLDGELQHYTYKNMEEQFSRLHSLSTLAAKEEFRNGRRAKLGSILLNPILRTLKFYFFKKGFREGRAGFIVAIIEGYYTFMKYAKLWELEFMEKHRNENKID